MIKEIHMELERNLLKKKQGATLSTIFATNGIYFN